MPVDRSPGAVAVDLARPFLHLSDPSDDGDAARLLSGELRPLMPEPGSALVAALDRFIALGWLHPLLGGGAVKAWLSRPTHHPQMWADAVWHERLAMSGCALGVADRAIGTIVVRLASKSPDAEREMQAARLADAITDTEMLCASVRRTAALGAATQEGGAVSAAALLLVASVEVAAAALELAMLLVGAGTWTDGRLHRRAHVVKEWRRLGGGPHRLLSEAASHLFDTNAFNNPPH